MAKGTAARNARGVAFGILAAAIAFLSARSSSGLFDFSIFDKSADHNNSVVTDVTVSFCPSTTPCVDRAVRGRDWERLDKDLYLRVSGLQSAWLYTERKRIDQLTSTDKVVVDVIAGETVPGQGWERRPGGFWILRKHALGIETADIEALVTDVDVLFGTDAVDPRPAWHLTEQSLRLATGGETPVARISVRHGIKQSKTDTPKPLLNFGDGGKFKIVQIADIHGSTGPGFCRDAIDAQGNPLPELDADPRTVKFMNEILDKEKPDLVVLGGDNVHFTALDTKSTILKFVAPMIERGIPFAAIFGNHDDSGRDSLSRREQIALFQTLPYSLSEPGPEDVEGVGNYHIRIEARLGTHQTPLDLLFMDTHNVIPAEGYVYDSIKPSQMDWFNSTMQRLKSGSDTLSKPPLSLLFIHIPIPEYADNDLVIAGGQRHEAVCGPEHNSRFYERLVEAKVSAVSCGHDHVNDYCGIKRSKDRETNLGPWLCYGGGAGFGAYGGRGWYHRRARVFEIDSNARRIETWKRVEYRIDDAQGEVDKLLLVDGGKVVVPS